MPNLSDAQMERIAANKPANAGLDRAKLLLSSIEEATVDVPATGAEEFLEAYALGFEAGFEALAAGLGLQGLGQEMAPAEIENPRDMIQICWPASDRVN